jgi:hypothetical protein
LIALTPKSEAAVEMAHASSTQLLRSAQSGQAFVGEHAPRDRGDLRPSFQLTVGKDGVRRRARAGLARRHAIDDVGDARSTDRITAQHARFDGRIQRAAAQIEGLETLARLAYGFHFCVCAGVERRPRALDTSATTSPPRTITAPTAVSPASAATSASSRHLRMNIVAVMARW